MSTIRNILKLLRVDHWVKNFFLFIPIFFAGELTDGRKFLPVLAGFFCFGLVASTIYIFNDIMDRKSDQAHPEKSKRPLASGEMPVSVAWIIVAVSMVAGLGITHLLGNQGFFFLLVSYLIINVLYSLGLKRLSIVEMIIVSSGFVLRAVAGGVLAGVEVSQWMLMMIFLLALFLALAKRRDDMLLVIKSGASVRKVIQSYSLEYLNSLLIMVSGVIIVAYLMYVISPEVVSRFHSKYLYITSIFVIAGVMRYLQITLVENKAASPTKILYRDNFIRSAVILWIITFYLIIY